MPSGHNSDNPRPKRQSDIEYNVRRKARRRINAIDRELERNKGAGPRSIEVGKLLAERQVLQGNIADSYKKANPSTYKDAIRRLEIMNENRDRAAKVQKLEKQYEREFAKLSKKNDFDFNKDDYVSMRKGGRTEFLANDDKVYSYEGEFLRQLEPESQAKPYEPQIDKLLSESRKKRFDEHAQAFNSLDKNSLQEFVNFLNSYDEGISTKYSKHAFFAMLQPLYEIDNRLQGDFTGIVNYLNAIDENANIESYYDLYKYVLVNPKYREIIRLKESAEYDKWVNDETWLDIDEMQYEQINFLRLTNE